MTITQTVEVPDTRRLTIDVPREVPTGRIILSYTPAPPHPCPICVKNIDPETGNPRYNAETIAAMEEADAIARGEIPAKRFNSLDEMWNDLMSDNADDESSGND